VWWNEAENTRAGRPIDSTAWGKSAGSSTIGFMKKTEAKEEEESGEPNGILNEEVRQWIA
jgi:hypothetical protein